MLIYCISSILPSNLTFADVHTSLGHEAHPSLGLLTAEGIEVVDVRRLVCDLKVTDTNPPFTPCKCVSVNVRVQLPSDVLKMHQSQTGSPELEGIHPRYVVYLVVVCCAGCNPFALIADVKDRSDRRD